MEGFGPANQVASRGVKVSGAGEAGEIVVFHSNRPIGGGAVAISAMRDEGRAPITTGFSELERSKDAVLEKLAIGLTACFLDHAAEQHVIDVGVFVFGAGLKVKRLLRDPLHEFFRGARG